MPEEGAKSSLGWRVIAVGSLFFLAVALALMTFVFLPDIPSTKLAAFTGVTRVAFATAAGIRDYALVTAGAFIFLGLVTGLGYADRLLKIIAGLSLVTLVFFAVATWWTLRTLPVSGLIDLR